MSAGKGPGVAQGYRTKQWENAKLWKNFKKDKNKIIFIDERDDIPQEVFEQIVMNRSKAMSDVVSDLMNTIDELNIKNNDLEKENAELREASLKVGSWLSAALDDDKTCEEMKKDIRIFFNALGIKEQSE